MSRPYATGVERVRQAGRLLQSEGAAGILGRLRERAAVRLVPPGAKPLLVSGSDFHELAGPGDSDALSYPAYWAPGAPMKVAWVCVPPGGGSGGHTTMFRMVAALEEAGHSCVVYLRERHGWDVEQHRRTIQRWWPWVKAEIRDLADGIEDCDAIFATGWDTAYTVRSSPARGVRFYFVQDFEPAFSAAGSAYLLAEATYSFGFHGITAGRWLSRKLLAEYDMPCDHFDFGCDLETYSRPPAGAPVPRTSISYYCRPSSPRRAHELAVFALELFAARHPEIEIHFYGEPVSGLPFPFTHHGLLTPAELGELYHRCVAGLVLSATNVSLVPHEMLAAGCIPVVNDADHNRIVLANDNVAYAAATPQDLADALSALVERTPDVQEEDARRAAGSVHDTTWSAAAEQVQGALVAEVERRWRLSRTAT